MKPILFNAEMVRAILDGRKTVTRRVIKPQPEAEYKRVDGLYRDSSNRLCAVFAGDPSMTPHIKQVNAPYQPGNILWVRETWHKDDGRYMYKANYSPNEKFYHAGKEVNIPWRPSIHMPREAARLFLRVIGVRAERLRDMCLVDVLMEGILEAKSYEATWDRWHETWNSTIKPADRAVYGWKANPWVWVIGFERISKEEADG